MHRWQNKITDSRIFSKNNQLSNYKNAYEGLLGNTQLHLNCESLNMWISLQMLIIMFQYPPVRWRIYVKYSHLGDVRRKYMRWQSLGKDISQLRMCRNMSSLNTSFLGFIMNQVTIDFNTFGSFAKDRVGSYMQGSLFITIENGGIWMIN